MLEEKKIQQRLVPMIELDEESDVAPSIDMTNDTYDRENNLWFDVDHTNVNMKHERLSFLYHLMDQWNMFHSMELDWWEKSLHFDLFHFEMNRSLRISNNLSPHSIERDLMLMWNSSLIDLQCTMKRHDHQRDQDHYRKTIDFPFHPFDRTESIQWHWSKNSWYPHRYSIGSSSSSSSQNNHLDNRTWERLESLDWPVDTHQRECKNSWSDIWKKRRDECLASFRTSSLLYDDQWSSFLFHLNKKISCGLFRWISSICQSNHPLVGSIGEKDMRSDANGWFVPVMITMIHPFGSIH